MEYYLLNYLKNTYSDPLSKRYIDYFKVELDWHIYAYGDNLSRRYHRNFQESLGGQLRKQIQRVLAFCHKSSNNSNTNNILAFWPVSDQDYLESMNLRVYSSLFYPFGKKDIIGDPTIYKLAKKVSDVIHKYPFFQTLDRNLFEYLEEKKEYLKKQYLDKYNLQGLFLYTDQYFIMKYHIDIFKQIGRPSFIFSHGLPGIYSQDIDNRSDYLMVWGEQMRSNYIQAGFDPGKIKVVGNSRYSSVPDNIKLRNTLDDILVLPIAPVFWHQHEWGKPIIGDRSLTVLYLYQIQHALQKKGVKRARVRPHPSVNKQWLSQFLDPDFYSMDYQSLNESLARTTLAIGSTSTTILESMMAGVNYLVYEPVESGIRLTGTKPVPPFDGSEPGLQVATTLAELEQMITSKHQNDYQFVKKYIQPLDLSVLKTIIK